MGAHGRRPREWGHWRTMEGGYLVDWQALHEAYLVAARRVGADDPELPDAAAAERAGMPGERRAAKAAFERMLGAVLDSGDERCPHGMPIGVDLALPEPHRPTSSLEVSGDHPTGSAPHHLRLLAGPAMGSGRSPWTRTCLRALERAVEPGASVLDVGTGTGILGLHALRLGAASADGLDDDPLAALIARRNARANGLADRFRAIASPGEAARGYDLAIVALTGVWEVPPVVDWARARLAPGSRVIASPAEGVGECAQLELALRDLGLAVQAVDEVEGWFAITAGPA